MKHVLAAAALLLAQSAGAQSVDDLAEAVLVEPPAPPGSPPRIPPGSTTLLPAGASGLRQFAATEGSKVEASIRGKGLIGATLYDAEGTPLSTQSGVESVRLIQTLAHDGIYYLAPLGTAGITLEVALTVTPPLPPPKPAEPSWKAEVTKLGTEQTPFGRAYLLPVDQIVSGNFAQAIPTSFDTARPAILYRFEGRLAQRVKVTVRSPEVHSLVKILRTPDDLKPLRSSDAQYRGDVAPDSVLDRYLPADGAYFVMVQAYRAGPKGERDTASGAPQIGTFTIQLGLE